MNISEHIPEDFSDSSRVWIYQSNRLFTLSEAFDIDLILKDFVESWNSHGSPVKGYANLFYGRFIVFIADETATGVSGCSTDSSVRLVKKIEQQFKVNMFDRLVLAFLVKGKVEQIPMSQIAYAAEHNLLNADTPFFDNSIQTKKQLVESWPQPAVKTWLAAKFPDVA